MNTGTIYVFCAPIPFGDMNKSVIPESRQLEIEKVRNLSLVHSKKSSWNLLSLAVSSVFSKDMYAIDFRVSEYGKWICDDFEFSLSHTDKLVAAAVSDFRCGVDVEKMIPLRFSDSLSKKALTHNEYQYYKTLDTEKGNAYATGLWTKKESIFKIHGTGSFSPGKIQADDFYTKTSCLKFEGDTFFLSAAAECDFEIRYHFPTDDITIMKTEQ